MGEIVFHRPVKARSIVKIYVKNVDIRTSSIGFDLVAKSKGDTVITASMVFVCIDAVSGKKKPITAAQNY